MRIWVKIMAMMSVLTCVILFAAMPSPAQSPTELSSQSITASSDQIWADLLARYWMAPPLAYEYKGTALFCYEELANNTLDMARLDQYIEDMIGRDISKMSRDTEMAYWANFYNALTVRVVAQHYPVKSIKKIKPANYKGAQSGFFPKGVWRVKIIEKDGKGLSLNDIEHKILRRRFKTPMVHYMLNCASIGCPNLKPTPWQAASLQLDQESAARDFIKSPRGVQIEKGRLTVSKIYKWFAKDFGGSDEKLIAHLKQFSSPEQAEKLSTHHKINAYRYDWALNEMERNHE